MKLGVYSVKDNGVGAFLQPFYCRSDAEAVRSFSDACYDTKHQFNKHPVDYHLYRIATFEDEVGEFVTVHVHLSAATSFMVIAEAELPRRSA